MKIVKFITGVSKKLAKVESWKLPSQNKTPALPAPAVDEEKAEEKPLGEEKSKKAEDDVPPPKPPGQRKALLIGIQFYPDPEAAELQEPPVAPSVPPLPSAPSGHVASTAPAPSSTATPPTPDAARRTTPSLAASSSLASITSCTKAKFMQTCSISSPLTSASTFPSSSSCSLSLYLPTLRGTVLAFEPPMLSILCLSLSRAGRRLVMKVSEAADVSIFGAHAGYAFEPCDRNLSVVLA
ncbi:hypothetical protein BKA70DRAFT_1427103 [Coprinopsis sp. MPI-PUGE-AT-0042]|nr:hypothetical protein BKA70DRAFT_1427103 [Coprinopsis sp. MPI-PUGE-AT-0042]